MATTWRIAPATRVRGGGGEHQERDVRREKTRQRAVQEAGVEREKTEEAKTSILVK